MPFRYIERPNWILKGQNCKIATPFCLLEVKYDHEMSIAEIYSGRSWAEVHQKKCEIKYIFRSRRECETKKYFRLKKIWNQNIFLMKEESVKSKYIFIWRGKKQAHKSFKDNEVKFLSSSMWKEIIWSVIRFCSSYFSLAIFSCNLYFPL